MRTLSTHPVDNPWSIDWHKATLTCVPIHDALGRLVAEIEVSDFKPHELQEVATHIVAVHNGWLERQRHLDRTKG
jgi:hypothetical protein